MKPFIHNKNKYAFVTEKNGISYWRNVNDPKDEVSFDQTKKVAKLNKKIKIIKWQ